MIPASYRLKLSNKTPFSGAKKYGSWVMVVLSEGAGPQWAVRVGKRIDRRAVVRNRLKRQLNQWLYQQKDNLKSRQFLVILRRKPGEENMSELYRELQSMVGEPLNG